MKKTEQTTNNLVHELSTIRSNMRSCFRKLSDDRRAQNPYSILGNEVLEQFDQLIEKLDQKAKRVKAS